MKETSEDIPIRIWKGEFCDTKYLFWVASSEKAAVHLWITKFHKYIPDIGRAYGGVECHYDSKVFGEKESYKWIGDTVHEHCMFLGRPCLHGGSSLAADPWIDLFFQTSSDEFDNAVFPMLKAKLKAIHADLCDSTQSATSD